MKYLYIAIFCFGAPATFFGGDLHSEDGAKLTLVHYMPWYSSRPVSGHWGWHWTMDHFNPEKVTDGRREVASHDYPLMGPYDSNDPHALQCHVLLMKFAGIDGVIVDWYGIEEYRDYGAIHRNVKHLLKHIKRAGLKFAVCYEDQTVGHLIEGKVLQKQDGVAHGKKVMEWLGRNWFVDDAYLTVDRKPVMLVFGPQYFGKEPWTQVISSLVQRPLVFALPHLSKQSRADGAFGWPPVHGGKTIAPAAWRQYLHSLYARGKQGEPIIAAVFPGFHDIYKEARLHDSYGHLDGRAGKTFKETFELAWNSNSRLIQIATWNDFGEGTMIEPTSSYGYRYLEIIQQRAGRESGPSFSFVPADLRLPVMLYQLRKQSVNDQRAMDSLDRVSTLLFSSKCDAARSELKKLEQR